MLPTANMTIDPELKALIPPLSPDELAQLETNILADGCREPLVCWNDILIDGHNRFAICSKHNIPFRTIQRVFESKAHVRIWMRDNQLGRRNLSAAWLIDLAIGKKADLIEIGRAKRVATFPEKGQKGFSNVLSPGDRTLDPLPKVDTRQEIAKAAGVSTGQIGMAEQVMKKAPKLWEKAKQGEVSIKSAYAKVKKEIKAEQDKRDLAEAQNQIDAEKRKNIESVCDLRACSCADLFASGIRPDAVITDPPYPHEFLPVFTELAEGCKAAEVPLVAVMSGQSYLPEVIQRLSKHLRYRWTLAYMTPGGQAVQQWQAKVNTSWKPVLLFGEALEWFGDVATSKPNDNDKRFHTWGQSESGIADLVERLTKPGQLVCDPFLGGGTTAVVCLALGRRFVGCDIDPAHIQQTKARVAR
jgi:hypothetical protein